MTSLERCSYFYVSFGAKIGDFFDQLNRVSEHAFHQGSVKSDHMTVLSLWD